MTEANLSVLDGGYHKSPKCRIRCLGSRIQVGNREFISATEALQAYLDQYTGVSAKTSGRYDMNVTDLLDPKSALYVTAERSLQTGVRDTSIEMKLAQAKDNINLTHERMQKSNALRAEGGMSKLINNGGADDALDRSGALLNRIAKDEKEPLNSYASDIGSMSTDNLISVDPSSLRKTSATSLLMSDPPTRSGHVYSYRTERTRSRSLSRERPSTVETSLKKDLQGQRPPSSYRGLNASKPKERSRSVSPSTFRSNEQTIEKSSRRLPKWETDLDTNSSKYKSPSWIEALDISNPNDNLWSKRDLDAGRPPPSWVHGLDSSDISSSITGFPQTKDTEINNLLPPNMDSSLRDSSIISNPPGLSFGDLASTPNKGKSVNFDLSSTEFRRSRGRQRSPRNLDIVSKLPREVRESGNFNSSDVLDKYLGEAKPSRTSSAALENSLIKGDDQYEALRCSSLDTEALLNGLSAPAKSDITGASPIEPDMGKSPLGTRSKKKKSRPQTPDTDLVLEGDRPWEKPVASFKAPVYVDEEQNATGESLTLTGRQQPGSLETLKNMLFKLQAESTETSSSKDKIAELLATSQDLVEGATGGQDVIPALEGYNYQSEPGGQSLERAMVHLNRLKTLVDNNNEARSRSQSRERCRSPHHSRDSSLSRSRSASPLRNLARPQPNPVLS